MTNSLLSPKQAAAELQMTLKTLRGHVADGTIAYVITGRGKKRPRYAFAPEDLEAYRSHQRRRNLPCQPTGRAAQRSMSSIFATNVVGFSARREKLQSGKLTK